MRGGNLPWVSGMVWEGQAGRGHRKWVSEEATIYHQQGGGPIGSNALQILVEAPQREV